MNLRRRPKSFNTYAVVVGMRSTSLPSPSELEAGPGIEFQIRIHGRDGEFCSVQKPGGKQQSQISTWVLRVAKQQLVGSGKIYYSQGLVMRQSLSRLKFDDFSTGS